ncbi:alpha/beta hydrolase family esterase [Clostridium vitabionis]|uniref:alpha/beta hydrolase family esterase n=1 Tax=Clostridium vitabionis TaxID=2784388 RepID=UPI00188C607A|nr:PHB depolymerase family esterase [Clostridium vitabionis]
MLEVKSFPIDLSHIEIDRNKLNACLFTGLYEETTDVGGKSRRFYTYLKPGLSYARPCVFVVPDDRQDTLTYLENSFWMDFAEKADVFLFVLTPENGRWNLDGSDAEYINRVYMQVQSRRYYVTIQDTMYAAGIGAGAVVAQQAAMKMTSEWAGLATFGDLGAEAMRNANAVHNREDTGRTEMAIVGAKAPLPVWMFWSGNTGANAEACAYWKRQNQVDPERYQNADADEIYFPATVWKKSLLNEQPLSEVRITNGFHGEVTAGIWAPVWKFLKRAFRYRSRGKMLRRRREPGDYGLEVHSLWHDGFQRFWYEYVPDSVKESKEPVPLVTAQHARGSSAEFFISLSDVTAIAEERGFIAVFPQASCYQQKPGGIPNIPLWNGSCQGKDFDDTGFILKMIADVKSRRSIDSSRVYALGQSSGAMMTSALGLSASGEFAAVACSSALIDPEREVPQPEAIDPAVPYLFLFGENDWLVAGKDGGELEFGCNPDIARFVRRLMALYHLDPRPMEYSSGEIHFYVYRNSRKVPMLTVGRIADMSHAIYPRETWLMYDEFMSRFSRREDGTLLYMGEPALSERGH